jgi:hypothetical protein
MNFIKRNRSPKVNYRIHEEFSFVSRDVEEQAKIYNVFKHSYEQSTGSSWDEGKFKSRASNWILYGSLDGFVAVRPQRSGYYKLVGAAGAPTGIYKGMKELEAMDRPVWGMMDERLASMLATKFGFIKPPGFMMKALMHLIPASVFGGANFTVNGDGSVTLSYNDVGDAKKYFVANKVYFSKIKSSMGDKVDSLEVSGIVKSGIKLFLKAF